MFDISQQLMDDVEELFYHGPSRAKNHDLRFGQYLVNIIHTKYPKVESDDDVVRILFNLENNEFWELIKDYNK